MSLTVGDFVTNVQSWMDAEQSNRWTPAFIKATGDVVMQNEWSGILNANRFYRCNPSVAVTTDANGQVAISSLTTGSGDSTQYFYRIVTGFTDGNILWQETDLSYVPLGTQANFSAPYLYVYYLQGDAFQLLPVQSGLNLTVAVNHTPPTITQLTDDSSIITFPSGYERLLEWVTAGTLLMKGAAESQAASDLLTLADSARQSMLGDIGRRTTRPTFALYPDSASAWNGGISGWGL